MHGKPQTRKGSKDVLCLEGEEKKQRSKISTKGERFSKATNSLSMNESYSMETAGSRDKRMTR